MKKTILLFILAVMSAAVFGQVDRSRISAFSGVEYNDEFRQFSFNLGAEYSYYLNNRVYMLGTFYSNFKSMEMKVTATNNGISESQMMDVPTNNLRLQIGAGVDLLRPNDRNRLYLQGQAGLGYLYGKSNLPEIGSVSYKGSMKTVGGSFGYDRKLNDRWALGAAYIVDYNWLNITHGLIGKVSYLF